MKSKIKEIVSKAIEQTQANKTNLERVIASNTYSAAEIRRQTQEVKEKNAAIVKQMQADLLALKASEVERANEAEVRGARISDTEVSNILAMLSLSAAALSGQEINDLYKEHYHQPLIRRSLEGIAKVNRVVLDPVQTKAIETDHMFRQHIREYVGELHPKEINAHLEVVTTVMSLNRGE